MKYNQIFRVGIREVALDNKLSNYGILAFLEDIATFHSDTAGYGIKDVISKKRAWLIMDWELEVFKRVAFGDKVCISTNAVPIEKPTYHSYRVFEIKDVNNNVIAIATSKWVLYDIQKNKLKEIEPENTTIAYEERLAKIKEPDFYESVINYTVNRDYIDIIQHMNNLNYLKLAKETIPEDLFMSEECNHLRIMYKHQIKLGEKVKCFYSKQKDGHYVSIKSENESTLHAIVKMW